MRNVFGLLMFLPGSFLLAQTTTESYRERISRHYCLSQYDSVTQYYELKPIEETDSDSVAATLNLVAKCYYYLGQNNTSIATYQRILRYPPRDPAILAKVYCTYSEVLIETAQYELASFQLSYAENILSELKRPDLDALMYNNRGVLYLRTSRHSQALHYLNVASRIAQQADDRTMSSITLNNFGILYYDIGNYQDALKAFQEALNIDLTINNAKDLAVDYLNIGNLYCDLNDKPGSIEFFQKAKQTYATVNDSAGMSLVLGNLSTVYIDLKKYVQAEESLAEAVKIARMTGDRLGETEWLLLLALVDYEKGNYADSYIALNDVAHRFQNLESFAQYGKTLIHMAKCKQKLQEYTESEKLLMIASENYNSKNLYRELWRAQSGLAELYAWMRRDGEADSFFRESIRRIEDAREDLSTELRTYFIENDRLDVYRSYVVFLIRQKRNNEAFDIYEKAKARNLSDVLHSGEQIKTVQAAIVDSGLLIEYFMHAEQSYVFVKSAKEIKVFPIGKKKLIDKLVIEYLTQIKQKKKDRNVFFKLSVKLYHEVWEPIEKEIRSSVVISVIPDECLYYLPFESLYDGHKFITEKYELMYAPSALIAQNMQRSKQERDTANTIAVFTQSQFTNAAYHSFQLEDLPHAASEADKIKNIFLDRAEIFSGQNLTISVLSDSILSRTSIVHFAAHGFNHPEKPELSAISLWQPDSSTDGLLKASEIQKMQLGGKLIVLSACETSIGPLLKGEGMLGLTRAFMIAGASSIVASMWNVYDESTAEFMRIFYDQKENQKLSNSKALQQAKIAMIQNEKWNDPAFWAPFVLWGRGN